MEMREIIAIIAGLMTISGIITGGSVWFNRKTAQMIEDNVGTLITNLTDFIKKNEQDLSKRIDDLDLDFSGQIDKLENKHKDLTLYAEANRERIHEVREKVVNIRTEVNMDHPNRKEFEQVLEDLRVLKQWRK